MIAITVTGFIFCPIAGIMAFVITYEEYSRHRLRRRDIVRRSLEAAAVTTGIFALLVLALGVLMPSVVGRPD